MKVLVGIYREGNAKYGQVFWGESSMFYCYFNVSFIKESKQSRSRESFAVLTPLPFNIWRKRETVIKRAIYV